jgi:hypothetical protein
MSTDRSLKCPRKVINRFMDNDLSYTSLDDLVSVWERVGIYAFKSKKIGKDMFQNNRWKFKVYRGYQVSDNGVGASILEAALVATAFAISEVESE